MASGDNHIHESLRHLAVPVDDLTPDPRNARVHNDRNLNAISDSLLKFGFRQPLVVQRQGSTLIVRAGNGRLQAAKNLGWASVPCIIVDESESDAIAFAIADNRTADLAEWDGDNLAAILSDIEKSGDSLGLLGWSDHEVAGLAIDDEPEDLLSFLNKADAVPAKKENLPKSEESRKVLFSAEQWRLLKDSIDGPPTAAKIILLLAK